MHSQIQFGAVDGVPLLADLYLPDGAGPHPLVVAVSGGGWIRGDRRSLASWARLLAAHGFAVASIDYRRAVKGPVFPGNVEDVAAALGYFADNAAQHGLDAGRMALLGASAGGHLAALAALSPRFSGPRLKGLACIYGVFDLFTHWQADLTHNAGPGEDKTSRMLGATPFDAPQLYHDASPLRQITYAKAMPVFLAWGRSDRDVLPRQSESFADALRQARFQVRTHEIADAGHLWFSEEEISDPASHCARLAPELLRFFKRIFLVAA
jgi:acetyl esterase/lipase